MVTQNLFYNRQPLKEEVLVDDLVIPLVISRGVGFDDVIFKRNIEDSYNTYDNAVSYSDSSNDFRLLVQRIKPKKCGDNPPTEEKYKLSLTLRSNEDHKKFADTVIITIGVTIVLEAKFLEVSLTSGYTTLIYEATNLLDPNNNPQQDYFITGLVSSNDLPTLRNPTKYYKDYYSSAQLDGDTITIRRNDIVVCSFNPKWISDRRDIVGVICFPIPNINLYRVVVVTNTPTSIHVALYHTTSDNSMQSVYLLSETEFKNNYGKDVLRLDKSFLLLTVDSCYEVELDEDFNYLVFSPIPTSAEMRFYNTLGVDLKGVDAEGNVVGQLEELPHYNKYSGSTGISEEIEEVMQDIILNPKAIPTMSEDSQEVAKVMVSEDTLSDIDSLVLRNDISYKLGEF